MCCSYGTELNYILVPLFGTRYVHNSTYGATLILVYYLHVYFIHRPVSSSGSYVYPVR